MLTADSESSPATYFAKTRARGATSCSASNSLESGERSRTHSCSWLAKVWLFVLGLAAAQNFHRTWFLLFGLRLSNLCAHRNKGLREKGTLLSWNNTRRLAARICLREWQVGN